MPGGQLLHPGSFSWIYAYCILTLKVSSNKASRLKTVVTFVQSRKRIVSTLKVITSVTFPGKRGRPLTSLASLNSQERESLMSKIKNIPTSFALHPHTFLKYSDLAPSDDRNEQPWQHFVSSPSNSTKPNMNSLWQ